ncbi:MAG: glutathione S-transferase N-terminal domain-containing protein, partial [Myxococcales bacterium]
MTVPSDRPYEFHAFDVSYFSAKVRPALRYKRVWYDEIRADVRYIKQRTGLAFIPMLITPEDEAWQDSTDIYDRLEARHPEPPLFPATPLQRIAAHLIELYTDEFALIPAMHYR